MAAEVRMPIDAKNIISEGYAYGTLKCWVKSNLSPKKNILVGIEELRDKIHEMIIKIRKEYEGSDLLEELGEVYIMILNDPLLWEEFKKKAYNRGGKLSTEDIIEVRDYIIKLLLESGNPLIQERQDDIKDLFNALLYGTASPKIEYGDIVYTDELYPSDVVKFHSAGVGAILSRKGSPTAHASILASALEIPYICNVPSLEDYCNMPVFVDAIHGEVVINPEDINGIKTTIEEYKAEKQNLERYSSMRFDEMQVMANISFLAEVDIAKKKGADGVGLFRTEFLFLNRTHPPSEEEQFLVYRKVLDAFYPDKVIIRLLDVGGDKEVPYLTLPKEENPFLGVRGIRALMKNEEILMTQLRALVRASKYGNLGIMIPMVSKPEEVLYIRRLLKDMDIQGKFSVGIMVEVPSVIFSIEKFVDYIDFVSIGTNDLTQYMFAADRGNPEVSEYYNDEDTAILNAIELVVKKLSKAKKPVGICGELAGKEHMVKQLMDIRVDSLSVSPAKVPRIKKTIYEELRKGST